MKSKLTLRLDDDVIERARAYATQRGTSVSALAEAYFRMLTAPAQQDDGGTSEAPEDWRARLSPRVRVLLGSARGPVPDVTEEDYRAYLAGKRR
jgi:hypothetical protein